MRVLRLERTSDLPAALTELGFTRPLPTIVVVGAADRLTSAELEFLEPVLDDLAALVERTGAAVVDGGTDAGVMRLVGRARGRGRDFPLVGVVVAALAGEPGAEPAAGQAPLEPNHSHVLLVPGAAWGDEVPWLARVAGALAAGAPSATVLLNGGDISYADAAASIAAGRRVLAVAGTGGAADAVVGAIRGEPAEEPARALAASELVRVVELSHDSGPSLIEEIERIVSGGS